MLKGNARSTARESEDVSNQKSTLKQPGKKKENAKDSSCLKGQKMHLQCKERGKEFPGPGGQRKSAKRSIRKAASAKEEGKNNRDLNLCLCGKSGKRKQRRSVTR